MNKPSQASLNRTIVESPEFLRFVNFSRYWSPKQLEIIRTQRPFRFLLGGNGSGKSCLGSWMTAAVIPYGWNPVTGEKFRRDKVKPMLGYCVADRISDYKDHMQPALADWLPREMYRVLKTGNGESWIGLDGTWKIAWKAKEQKRKAFQRDEVDWVWIDEEIDDKTVWNEILARTFRRLGQIMVTMTFLQSVRWLHTWMYSPKEYPQEQKRVVRLSVPDNPYYRSCNCEHHEIHHKDGALCDYAGCDCKRYDPSRGQQKIDRAKMQYRGIEYKIRFEGHALLLDGTLVIPTEIRDRHIEESEKAEGIHHPPLNCAIQGGRLQPVEEDHPYGFIRVAKMPVPGNHYVMGLDLGSGNPLGDYHAGVIFEVETGIQVALLHNNTMSARDITKWAIELARMYNDAFTVIEVNSYGLSAFDTAMELGYHQLYMREPVTSIAEATNTQKGWWTDGRSKPTAVLLMRSLVCEKWKVTDPIIHGEMYGYSWLKENRIGSFQIGNANGEEHDDTMSALFLAAVGWRAMGYPTVEGLPEEVTSSMEAEITDQVKKGYGKIEGGVLPEADPPDDWTQEFWEQVEELVGEEEGIDAD